MYPPNFFGHFLAIAQNFEVKFYMFITYSQSCNSTKGSLLFAICTDENVSKSGTIFHRPWTEHYVHIHVDK